MHFIQTTQKSYNYTLICSGIIPIDNKPISTAHLSQLASFIWGRQESMHIQKPSDRILTIHQNLFLLSPKANAQLHHFPSPQCNSRSL